MTLLAASAGWTIGLVLGIVGVAVVAGIVVAIVVLARGILSRAGTAVAGVEKLRAQTDSLAGINRINDSGVRILHSARSLRKVVVGK